MMYDKQLEQSILSIALNDSAHAMELLNSTNSDYYSKDTKWLFNILSHYFNDPNIKSIPTKNMIEEYVAAHNGPVQKCSNEFDRVRQINTDHKEFKWRLEKLKTIYNAQLQKNIIGKLSDLSARTDIDKSRIEEINAIMRKGVVSIDEINKRKEYKEGTLQDSAEERMLRYNQIEENPDIAKGILTGFSTFDQITNGIHPGEFMIVAGDTGGGKSVLLHNIAVNAYLAGNDPFDPYDNWHDRGRNVLYFSLEMPKEVMERRIDACMAGIHSTKIRDGCLTEDDKQRYFRILRFQKKYNKHIHIVDMPRGVTPREIELKYLELCESSFKPDLIVIDYMGIMSPNNAEGSDWMDLGQIAAEIHEMSRAYNISTLTGSQVNRSKDENYSTSRIARSAMIPQNANIIIHIANRPDEEMRDDMLVHITKMRDGEKKSFALTKDFAKMKLIDLVDATYGEEDEDDDL